MHRKLVYIFATFLISICFIGMGGLPSTTVHAASVQPEAVHSPVYTAIAVEGECPTWSGSITPHIYWWGNVYTFDHCAVQHLWYTNYVSGSAGAISFICAYFGNPLCSLVAGIGAVAIVTYVGALQGADSQCTSRGANLNAPFIGPPYVTAVC